MKIVVVLCLQKQRDNVSWSVLELKIRSDEHSERRNETENSDNSSDDAVFDPNDSLTAEEDVAIAAEHIEEWVSMLHRDDIMSLSLMLHHAFVNVCKMKKTKAAEEIGKLIGKSERTVREWRKSFYDNSGTFPDSEQGHYQRQGLLWYDEELCEAARDYVRANAVVKGRPNLTSISFTRWANDHLLPNSVGYLLGQKAGVELEKLVKTFSKEFKSHRRVTEDQ